MKNAESFVSQTKRNAHLKFLFSEFCYPGGREGEIKEEATFCEF